MAAELVNLASTERLPKGTVLRVTFASGPTTFASEFSRRITTLWEQIASTKLAYPVSPNPAIKNAAVAVMDLRVSEHGALAAAVVNAVEALTGSYLLSSVFSNYRPVTLTRVEKLTPAKAETAAGNTGAVEREAVKATEQSRQENQSSWTAALGLDTLADALGTTVTLVKWAFVAVAVVGVVYLVAKLSPAARQ